MTKIKFYRLSIKFFGDYIHVSLSLSLSPSPSPSLSLSLPLSLSLLTVHKLQGNTVMSYYGMTQLLVTGNNHVTFCV